MTSSKTTITILGLGSLLSERSSRVTFPKLTNFRLGRVHEFRRVFGHPASIFFQRGLANMETMEYSSLAAEKPPDVEDDDDKNFHVGFICSVFEVPLEEIMTVDGSNVPSHAFLEREEEFDITLVPYTELNPELTSAPADVNNDKYDKTMGVLCTRSTDQAYVARWGVERFQKHYKQYGIETIWGYKYDSGLKPCQVYLRHCYLAAQKMGPVCFDSFLDETYLVDRKTTIRQYIAENPRVIETLPPPGFEERYSG